MALGFTIDSKSDLQGNELKRRLLECVTQQKQNFLQTAENFYNQVPRTRQSYLDLTKAIIKAVDDLLAEAEWDESLYLRNCLRPLKEIREQALQLIKEEHEKVPARRPNFIARTRGMKLHTVYIALFQSQGYNLKLWELQLKSIDSHLVGRPVYAKEEDVQKVLRLKQAPMQEAYIAVEVQENTMTIDGNRQDRFGHQLISLTQDAVNLENILEFVHQDKRYAFSDGKLIEKE